MVRFVHLVCRLTLDQGGVRSCLTPPLDTDLDGRCRTGCRPWFVAPLDPKRNSVTFCARAWPHRCSRPYPLALNFNDNLQSLARFKHLLGFEEDDTEEADRRAKERGKGGGR